MISISTKNNKIKNHPLTGRRLYIPRMSTGAAEAMAAAFRSLGVEAGVSPQSDEETLTLAARFTTGEECLPQRVTLGNFLKVILDDAFEPSENAFFMPTSAGPCRFGQYAPLLKKILRELGYENALVFSPTSSDGYEGIAANVSNFVRLGWRAIVSADILRKLLLMYRPYERDEGQADGIHDRALEDVCDVLSDGSMNPRTKLKRLVGVMEAVRDRFSKIQLKESPASRPLIGAVGEIYLRFNSFSNQHIVRKIEALGGEVWMADISEWVWYTNWEELRKLRERRKIVSPAVVGVKLRHWIQHRDEAALLAPFRQVFENRIEEHVAKILSYSEPYLPANMALGEMTLNTGKAIAFYRAGCDGVVDISPFTCMNGIVTESIYPCVSRDHESIPIRIFYFDGRPFDLEGDLEIFMEQVLAYRKRRLKCKK